MKVKVLLKPFKDASTGHDPLAVLAQVQLDNVEPLLLPLTFKLHQIIRVAAHRLADAGCLRCGG
jgi:hypothetical protein